jgi:translation initiation factor IF-2
VATVLVLRGCLKPTASLVAGTTWCRVRQLLPPTGTAVLAAYPGQPIEVSGWKELPLAGDEVLEAFSEDKAKDAVANRIKRIETEKMWNDVEVINEKRRVEAEVDAARKEGEGDAKSKGLKGNAVTLAGLQAIKDMDGAKAVAVIKELVIILKGDVTGTLEAVVGALEPIGNKEAKVKIVHTGVGDISDSDVEMARAVEGWSKISPLSFCRDANDKVNDQVALSDLMSKHLDRFSNLLLDHPMSSQFILHPSFTVWSISFDKPSLIFYLKYSKLECTVKRVFCRSLKLPSRVRRIL